MKNKKDRCTLVLFSGNTSYGGSVERTVFIVTVFTCGLPYNILEKRSITDAGKLLVLVWVSVTSLLPTELPTARVGIFQAYVL